MYKITNETPIEDDIEYIIETFHKPLPELVDKLNEIWHSFFYTCMEDENLWVRLQPLKEKFFLFSSAMLDHIYEEEEEEFPLIIEHYNNSTIPENENIFKKIVEEHNNFEKEFDVMEEELKNIEFKEGDAGCKEHLELLDIFNKYKIDSLKHIQAEITLLEKFFAKIKTLKEQVI